jgi:dTDP-4-amino-4,6-dideoxygalactose transaminase
MIPITKPLLGEEEAQAAAEVIRSGWLAQGARVEAFEQVVAAYVGAPHAVAVSSGTAALHLGLTAQEIGAGHEVILPSLSFIATANAVRYTGATPVFVDVDPRTFNVDPGKLQGAITPRTRAILPVHQLGLAADMDPIIKVARRHGLALVEDAACALGTICQGGQVGSSGRVCCFSFHPRKVITTGEGGMITTADDDLARRLRSLRSQGSVLPAYQRHQMSGVAGDEEHSVLGYNYRMTDIQAAVGLEQMKRLPGILRRRRALARRYSEILGASGTTIIPPEEPEEGSHAFQSYMVLLEGPFRQPWTREAVMQRMADDGIATRGAVTAIHLQPLYRKHSGGRALPVTEAVAGKGLMLPLYPELEQGEQDRVVESLLRACPVA